MKKQLKQLSIVASIAWCLSNEATFAAPPPNDNFASARVITGFPITVYGTNIDATIEASEPEPYGFEGLLSKSIWFKWTAPTSGLVQINTFGSTSPTTLSTVPMKPPLAMWVGTNIATLTEIRSGGGRQSRFINVSSGTTYRISVYGMQDGDYFDYGNIVLNITNDRSSHISGHVTGPDGTNALQGILVQANGDSGYSWENRFWDFTDASGNYTIRGLTSDTYRVVFYDFENRFGNPQYLTEYYSNSPNLWAAADIVVAGVTNIFSINASLEIPSTISGTVTGPNGTTPLEGISVDFYQWNDAWADWEWFGDDYTDIDGNYTKYGLRVGAYKIAFTDFDGDYLSEVYDDAASLDSGTDVIVTTGGEDVIGIDASLTNASKVSGTVTGPDGITPLQYAYADAYRPNGDDWVFEGGGYTDESGLYTIGGLPAGTYRILFQPPSADPFDPESIDYLPEVYADAIDLDSGTDIILPAATIETGIDASLAIARPQIVGLQTSNNVLTVHFTGVVDRNYILQRRSIQSNSWNDVGFSTNCVDGTNLLSAVGASTQSIWRIRRYP